MVVAFVLACSGTPYSPTATAVPAPPPVPSATAVPAPPPVAFINLLEDLIEDRWSDEFGDVIERQNIAMTEPVLALLEVYGCETQKTCESSLRSLPSGLGPAIEYLQTEIANLESLTPPLGSKPSIILILRLPNLDLSLLNYTSLVCRTTTIRC